MSGILAERLKRRAALYAKLRRIRLPHVIASLIAKATW